MLHQCPGGGPLRFIRDNNRRGQGERPCLLVQLLEQEVRHERRDKGAADAAIDRPQRQRPDVHRRRAAAEAALKIQNNVKITRVHRRARAGCQPIMKMPLQKSALSRFDSR